MNRQFNAMVVEDCSIQRRIIINALSKSGLAEFNFTEAEDGVDALNKYRPNEIDILFVDMRMPNKNGIEFLRDLRDTYVDIPPAVMITADMDVLQEALEAKVAAFLMKPIDPERIQKGLKKLIDSLPDHVGPSAVPHGECLFTATEKMCLEACQLEVVPEPDDQALREGEIVLGTISLSGDVQWTIVMGFQNASAASIASRFAGFEIPFDGADMGDASANSSTSSQGTPNGCWSHATCTSRLRCRRSIWRRG